MATVIDLSDREAAVAFKREHRVGLVHVVAEGRYHVGGHPSDEVLLSEASYRDVSAADAAWHRRVALAIDGATPSPHVAEGDLTDDEIRDLIRDVASLRNVEGVNELLWALDAIRETIAEDYAEELAEYGRQFEPPHPAEGSRV